MTDRKSRTRVAVIGAGIAGIATAHALAREGMGDIVLIDPRGPMSLTSARSGENFRTWWPQPELARLMHRSIELMEALAATHRVRMDRRGYLFASRTSTPQIFIDSLLRSYDTAAIGGLRIHDASAGDGYRPGSYDTAPCPMSGADVLVGQALTARHFQGLDPAISVLVHVRQAGHVDSQHLATCMLGFARERGARLVTGSVARIERRSAGFDIDVVIGDAIQRREVDIVVNAAGPFARDVARLLDVELPLVCVVQQKIAFEDHRQAVPRDAPFTIDLDDQHLDWSSDEAESLAASAQTAWLLDVLPGGVHCRPEGGESSRWVNLGWAFNRSESEPCWEPPLWDAFPEIALRGAARLRPALGDYLQGLPRARSHYGGYYTKTRENWPVIGPIDDAGAFAIAGLSGYGTMAACAAGELVCAWIRGLELPCYAQALSLERYRDDRLMARILSVSGSGEL